MLSIRAKTLLLLGTALFISASGCHTIGLSERYGNSIDRVADKKLCLDNCYRPGLDLTRLGRDCIHQEAMVKNIGFYPNNAYPNSVPVEQAAPPSEIQEPLQQDEYSPPAPVPASQLPIIDIDSLKEISQWTPKPERTHNSDLKNQLVSATTQQSSDSLETISTSEKLLKEIQAPVESIEARPMPPVSAPASVPSSQKFYSARQAQ